MKRTVLALSPLVAGLTLAFGSLAAAAAPAAGQLVDAPPPPTVLALARAGWDYQSEAPALGAQVRIPLPGGWVEVAPGGEAVFQDGITDYQGHLDAALALGRRSPFYAGAGLTLLNTRVSAESARETLTGYSLFGGIRMVPDRDGNVGGSLELRWLFVEDFRPQYLTIGIGVPLLRY